MKHVIILSVEQKLMDKRVQKIECDYKVTKTYGNMKHVMKSNMYVELIL